TVATAAGNFLGEPVAVGDILIRNTLLGDANLDGTVNFTDLLALAQSYNLTGKNWNQGDFNYSANGLVNFDDLLPTAQNYNVSLLADGSLSGEGMGFTPEFQAEWAFALASVPEPTTLAALAGVGLLALRRRK
ncbi:MAG TPA: PEP-CTERM sorting domain-containing protein, partial [Tepidisphaeraceae bacterium]|nr:PEP-CTERM sorting domain-containing protein [Tepidisphaeraceae bacterium]